jgi:hypothetical protein
LTLEALPRDDDRDGNRRMRSILKMLLRGYGFRCQRVEWVGIAEWPDATQVDSESAESPKDIGSNDLEGI